MYSNDVQVAAGVVLLVAWPLLWFASISTYRVFFGPELAGAWTRWRRTVLGLVSFAAGWAAVMSRLDDLTPGGIRFGDLLTVSSYTFSLALEYRGAFGAPSLAGVVAQIGGAGMAVVLAIALGVKLYEKWINGRLSEAERRTGAEGVRAWLSGANALVLLGIGVCFWLAFLRAGAVPLAVLGTLVLAGVVAAYPLVAGAFAGPAMASGAGAAARGADLTPERERVLRLLEEGRVTAEEAAELLSALGATLPPPAMPAPAPWTPGRKLMVAGALVVLVGFFLPWFEINLGREMRSAMSQAVGALPMGAEMQGMVTQGGDAVATGTPTVSISGGDIGHGLGWIALGLGVGAALVPLLLPTLAREQRRAIMTVALAGGAIILLYLLTGNLSRVSFGLPVVMIGYAVEIVGLVRDQFAWQVPAIRATAQAV